MGVQVSVGPREAETNTRGRVSQNRQRRTPPSTVRRSATVNMESASRAFPQRDLDGVSGVCSFALCLTFYPFNNFGNKRKLQTNKKNIFFFSNELCLRFPKRGCLSAASSHLRKGRTASDARAFPLGLGKFQQSRRCFTHRQHLGVQSANLAITNRWMRRSGMEREICRRTCCRTCKPLPSPRLLARHSKHLWRAQLREASKLGTAITITP